MILFKLRHEHDARGFRLKNEKRISAFQLIFKLWSRSLGRWLCAVGTRVETTPMRASCPPVLIKELMANMPGRLESR